MVALVALFIGVLSGWLGVGGGLLLIPALSQWLPTLVTNFLQAGHGIGMPVFLPLPLITGVAAVQNLAGSSTSAWVHGEEKRIEGTVIRWSAFSLLAGSYLGAMGSSYLSAKAMLGLLLFCLASTWLFSGYKILQIMGKLQAEVNKTSNSWGVSHKLLLAMATLITGLISGSIGIGGAIFLLPLFLYGFRMSSSSAVGTTALLVFLGALAAVAGKAQAGLIPIEWALAVTFFAAAGGWLGAKTHTWLSPLVLRCLHLLLVSVALLTSLLSLFRA